MSITVQTYYEGDAGYFRLGDVPFSLSPEKITINKVSNSEEIDTLRTKYPMIVETGQARWDIIVCWKALLGSDPSSGDYYKQWEEVRRVLAMVKAAPFVEVENEHLRQILLPDSAGGDPDGSARMAVALRQLTVATTNDIVDGIDCVLQMSLFNHLPYTKDFAYTSSAGGSLGVGALQSDAFKSYLNAWIKENLDNRPSMSSETAAEGASTPSWKTQTPGQLSLKWREYASHPGLPSTAPDDLVDWDIDHYTNDVTFRYLENELVLDSQDGDNLWDLYPQGFAVAFTNNLATLPMANYHYPTYQHLGPAGSTISISLLSTNYDGGGMSQISYIQAALKEQFFKFRSSWRSVGSVQRMQAIRVQNQFLNMLGIFGMEVKNFVTDTIAESSDSVQCQLVCRQYENIFEAVTPFGIWGAASYYNSLLTYLQTADFSAMSTGNQQTLSSLSKFTNAMKSGDKSYASSILLSTDPDQIKAVRSLPQVPLPVTIAPADLAVFQAELTSPAPGGNGTVATVYPEMAQRVNSGSMSYNDFLMLESLPGASSSSTPGFGVQSLFPTGTTSSTSYTASVAATAQKIEASWSSGTTEQQCTTQLLQQMFSSLMDGDPLLHNAVDQVTKSNDFQATIPKEQAFNGPGSDPSNIGHGAYMDLGLKSLQLGTQDFNPGYYFVDHGQEVFMGVATDISKMISTMRGAFGKLNSPTPNSATNTPVPSSVASYSSFQGLTSGDATPIMLRTSIPGYTMSSAFPTFKLFLMEENSQNLFYAFDDFYSYSSVKDIEVIRYREKPDEAVIQITNLAGLLNHKLFDNSAEGKRESFLSNAFSVPTAGSPNSDPIAGPNVPTKIPVDHTLAGRNLETGAGDVSSPSGTSTEVPLRYYSLQTGSKIQIRMGFSNNPDNLWPVFTGQITQIEDDDGMMTLVAQSYMIELMNPVPDEMKADGFNPLGILTNIARNFSQVLSADNLIDGSSLKYIWNAVFDPIAPAYDGDVPFGSLSDTGSVIKDMVQSSRCKHFGHWQAGAVVDPFLKGRSWIQTLGSLVPGSVGSALRSSYDRSADNILINYVINQNGDTTANQGPQRSFQYETVTGDYSFPYYISKDEARTMSPWKFIRDISRRFPEYQLSVKQYGFPYTADATLVFAHPLDYYYARDPLLKEVEQLKFDDSLSQADFATWWASTGRGQLTSTLNDYFNNKIAAGIESLLTGSSYIGIDPETLQITSPVPGDFPLLSTQFNRVYIDPTPFVANIDSSLSVTYFLNLLGVLDTLLDRYAGELKPQVMTGSKYYQARTAVSQMRTALAAYLQAKQSGGQLGTPDSFARVKPVTRFHFVDQESIVHNGIKLEDKIYNTIKIHKDIRSANDFIPAQHRRILDIFDDCVSPDRNLMDSGSYKPFRMAYIQSYLREEIGKMYKGELILRGTPQIEPYDIVVILDPSTGMSGPIEVDSVIHSFNQEMGFVTIIKPRALITMNESATATLLKALMWAWAHSSALAKGFQTMWDSATGSDKIVATLTGSAVIAGVTAGTLLLGAPLAVAGVLLVGLKAVSMFGFACVDLNPVFVLPLSRYDKPWIGGLEGYRQDDIWAWLEDEWTQVKTDDIQPFLEAWRTANNLSTPALAVSPNPAPPSPAKPGPEGNAGGDPSSKRVEDLDPAIRQDATDWLNAIKDAGYSYTVTSTRRSHAEQQKLWDNRAQNPNLVAKPGTSQHETGLALDVTFPTTAGLNYAVSICGDYNLTWQGTRDKVHFHKS